MVLGQEGVHADQRQAAVVLLVLVVQALFLDLAALVHGVHGAQHAAALADGLELLVHGLFHQVGQLVDDEAALPGVLVEVQPQLLVDDHLDGDGAAHALFGRRGDGLVVGVGVQAVAVVEQRVQRLQRGADVVELDFLRVQAAAAGLDVVLQFLAALVGAVLLAHGHGPDAARHPAHDGVFRVHAVAEEEAQIGREVVDVHAARQVRLHEGEAVREREGQLADRVGPGLGNVVPADGHRVEVAHVVVHEVLGDVAHDLQAELGAEDAGVLALVFLQDVGLHRAAHVGQRPGADLLGLVVGGIAAVVGAELVQVLVDGGVHEHRQDAGRRAVDGHGDRGGRVAQVEAAVEHLHVVQRGDAHAGVADLAVDVRAQIGVVAVERDRVEGGGQALGRHALTHQLEAAVGAERVAFAGEHAGRVFALALEGKGAGGVGEAARHVLQHQPLEQLAVVLVRGQGDLADGGAGERPGGQRGADLLVADLHHVLVAGVGLLHVGPLRQQLAGGRVLVQLALLGQFHRLDQSRALTGTQAKLLLRIRWRCFGRSSRQRTTLNQRLRLRVVHQRQVLHRTTVRANQMLF